MGPRPYSERAVLPRDSSNSSVSVESDTPQMTMDSSPGSMSAATTPSPIEHEMMTDMNSNFEIDEDVECDIMHSNPAFYPTPADSMPFDHAFPDYIRQLTNERNLANLHSLKLRVISRLVSLQRVSLFTTNLRELDLEGSILGSLRDIGCNLKHLQILKVGNCKLDSLDGTFGLTSLRKLYAQRNMITDVSPCSNLPHIQHIDVSHNRIRNIGYAGFLSVCRKLKAIVFTGNPATELPDYRDHVRRILPQLHTLDDVTFTEEERKLDHGEMEDFSDLSEEDQNEFYCNSFEKEEICPSSGIDSENHKIPKFDTRGLHGKDSNLLSLRKERDESKQVPVSRHGRSVNVNYEEMEDIVQNCAVPSRGQSGDSCDGFTLPPLRLSEKEVKRLNHSEKEVIAEVDKDCGERPRSKISDRSPSFPIGSNADEREAHDFDAMGARPKTTIKADKRSTSAGCSSNGKGFSGKDDENDGVRKRPSTAGSSTTSPEIELDEKFRKSSGHTSLTTGRPICGNLAVALRSRKKKQEMEESEFFSLEEPEVPNINEMQ